MCPTYFKISSKYQLPSSCLKSNLYTHTYFYCSFLLFEKHSMCIKNNQDIEIRKNTHDQQSELQEVPLFTCEACLVSLFLLFFFFFFALQENRLQHPLFCNLLFYKREHFPMSLNTLRHHLSDCLGSQCMPVS